MELSPNAAILWPYFSLVQCLCSETTLCFAAVLVRAREKTQRPVVLLSLLGVLGACTLMDVNMPAARPPANSGYRENTPKRLVTI